MADKNVTVVIEAVDEASQTIANVAKELSNLAGIEFNGLSGVLGTVAEGIQKVNDATRFGGGLQQYSVGLKNLGELAKGIVGSILDIGDTFLDVAGSVANADLSFQGLAKTAMNYDQTLERIGIKAGGSAQDLEKLDGVMKKLTTDTVYSMDEIATAAEYMVQNGMSVTEVIDNLASVTALATVGNIDLGRSADIVASTLNMFSRQGLTGAQVANILATAANSSGANVENLAKSLENCGPQAAALNIPFEQLVATLAIMGDNAIKGGKAGTAMKNVLQRMAAPTKDVASAIKEFHLEGAQAKIVTGDLKGGLLEMMDALSLNKVSAKDQQRAIKQLAGAYGAPGLTSVINTAKDELLVMFDAMEKGMVNTDNLTESMDKLMGTIQGQVMRFSANVQLLFYNLYTSADSSLAKVMEVMNDFLSDLNNGMSIGEALKGLEEEFKNVPEIIGNALTEAFGRINNFISTGALDSILNIGTSIITGICQGIINNADQIQLGVTNLISKFCDFIITNGSQITEAAKVILDAIKTGIETNSGKISEAADVMMNLLNTYIGGRQDIILAIGEKVAVPLISGFVQGTVEGFINCGGTIFAGLVQGVGVIIGQVGELGKSIADAMIGGILGEDMWGKCKEGLQSVMDFLWSLEGGGGTTKAQDAGLASGTKYGEKTKEGIEKSKSTVNQSAAELADGAATQIENRLNNLNAEGIKGLETELKNLQTTTTSVASGVATSFTSIADSARTNFLSFAGIVRSQMLNSTKIVKNQMDNMKGAIGDGAQAARDNLTRSFMSMASVVRTQMEKMLKTVNDFMDAIATATNRSFSMNFNVNRTVSTTYTTRNVPSPANFAVPRGYSLSASSPLRNTANTGLGSLMPSSSSRGNDRPISIEVPLVLEGREIAKASAIYTREELNKLEKRNSRKRGE